MSNIGDFNRILITVCNLQHFTRKCRIKNLNDFERDEAYAYLWRAGLLNVKEKGMTIYYIMNRCLVMFLREGKVNVAQYRTSCPSTPTESTPESSPVKICSVKSLLVEKRLDCFTSLKILHNLFYPAKNTPSLIVPS